MRRFALVFLLALGACGHCDWADKPTPGGCAAACAHLKELGCSHQEKCAETCNRALSVELNNCVSAAATCEAVDQCDL